MVYPRIYLWGTSQFLYLQLHSKNFNKSYLKIIASISKMYNHVFEGPEPILTLRFIVFSFCSSRISGFNQQIILVSKLVADNFLVAKTVYYLISKKRFQLVYLLVCKLMVHIIKKQSHQLNSLYISGF